MYAAAEWDVDGPGFDRQRLAPDRVPRVLELTSRLCAVNAARRTGPGTEPELGDDYAERRRQLLDELHRLIAG
jgi:hypothetical protein